MDDQAVVDAAIARVLAGDREAFAVLVDMAQDAVWQVAASLLQDRTVTEELVHQVFIRAYEHLDQYEPGTNVIAWLVTIARNLVRNHLRDRQRERRRMQLYHEEMLIRANDDGTWRDEDDRLRRHLAACQEQLAEDAREALRLFYAEDLAITAVAERLGRSAVATQKLLSRVRLVLRDCVVRHLADAP